MKRLPFPLSFAAARANNEAAGQFFFSPGAMRAFKSRLCGRMFGRYFVTSEKGPDNVRRYTVRRSNPSGDVSDVSDFQAYASRAGAIAHAKRADKADKYTD